METNATMQAEVISIGDELTSGQRLDTNSQWLSERLGELGVRVMFHTTVADDLTANVRVFREAVERADIVVSTGGLGPTADDLTRDALAQVAGVDLVVDEASMAHIEELFARRNRPMPERNRIQAMLPAGSRAIHNPDGTAPGIDLTLFRLAGGQARVFCLPGVPAEMREMWEGTVGPAVRSMSGGRLIRHRRIKCFGVGESELEQMLPDMIRRGRVPQVGITVSGATITLRISAEGDTPEACACLIEPTESTIRNLLADLVFGEEDDELQHAIVRLLNERQQTLATVEWGTAGLIAHWLADVPEGQHAYLGGLIISSAASLQDFMGVQVVTPERTQIEGAEVVKEMAAACQAKMRVDYALAVGDFPKFDPSASSPAEFYYAVATPYDVKVRSSPFASHPALLKILSAKRAMNLLRLQLLRSAAPAKHRQL